MGSLPRQQRYAKDVQYKINDMKQITISIILLLLIGGTACTAFAQETTTQDSLMIGKWRFIYPPHNEKGIEYVYTYSKTEKHFTVYFEKDTATVISHYYLSNEIPKEFDYNQIGKNETGKYLITLNTKDKTSDFSASNIYEIIELTATKLRLKQLSTSIIFEYEKIE